MNNSFIKELLLKNFFNFFKSWKRFYFDFSQFGEEKVIFNILQRISSKKNINPIYIDIGGYDPIEYSNTYKLYQKNWRGIIVEPNINKVKNWSKIRPNDYVVNNALVDSEYKEKKIKIYYQKKGRADETAYPNTKKDNLSYYEADTIRLSDIISLCEDKFSKPFFLNMDIEGNEEKLILELKEIEYIIPLICIEIFLPKNTNNFSIFSYKNLKAVNFLEDNGYLLVNVNGPSLIFCHKEFWVPYTKL